MENIPGGVTNTRNESVNDEDSEKVVMLETEKRNYLFYGVNKNPPIHIAMLCGIQHSLMSLTGQLVVTLLVAEAVCASDNELFKSRLLSSTLVMGGVTTIASALLGIRLPLFQAATAVYIIPLLMLGEDDDSSFCSSNNKDMATNLTVGNNKTVGEGLDGGVSMETILINVRALQGTLMLVGVIQALLGFTGIVGGILRYIGPLTIVPTMTLMFIFYVKPVLKFVEDSWAIAVSTVATAVILFLYLGKHNMPIPVWTPSAGYRVIRYPLHQVFALLISIVLNWLLAGLLTYLGMFTDDPMATGYKARTDARFQVLYDNPWFILPYPGQYGPIGFNAKAFIAFLIATLLSVIDSIGDYYACARVCRVPVPPTHAVNRGILVEGVCTILSGAIGCGHSTTTYGSNIGAIGVTKVASRLQFIFAGIFYIIFGLFGKISAFFISIPYPVLGGAIIVMFGIFFGVIISNLQVTNMSSPRNMAILGLSTFFGLLLPTWAIKTADPVNTGNEQFDKIAAMLLRNPSLTVILLSCILDNTVSGSKEERGIAAWQVQPTDDLSPAHLDPELYDEGYEVYEPWCPEWLRSSRLIHYIPFLPKRRHTQSNNAESKA